MKKVLITGIQGFTGRYVAAELESHGWEVWGTGVHEDKNQVRYWCVDMADAEGLSHVINKVQPDAVIHLAAVAFVGHGDANEFYRVNLIGTRNLLEVLSSCDKPLKCVLLASSANVYGNAIEGTLAETDTTNPANDYAVSKLAMEYMARIWVDRLPIVIVRPFNYTGVGQSTLFVLPKIVAHFRRKEKIIELGNLDIWRDFSDVRTVAFSYRRLLEECPVGETVNICSGRLHSLREILSMAEEISGHSMRVQVNSAFIRSNEVRRLCGNPSKLRSIIGHWEVPDLEATLHWMLSEEDV